MLGNWEYITWNYRIAIFRYNLVEIQVHRVMLAIKVINRKVDVMLKSVFWSVEMKIDRNIKTMIIG